MLRLCEYLQIDGLRRLAVGGLLIGGLTTFAVESATLCADPPSVTVTSPDVPVDVCIPPGTDPDRHIEFFDDFAWRSFIALVWPAQTGKRGAPDRTQKVPIVAARVPRVFETLKPLWEVFHEDGAPPGAWDSFDSPNPCLAQIGFGDMLLGASSKFSDLLQARGKAPVGPLIAQNQTYVRYSTGFNRILFDDIRARRLYRAENFPSLPANLRLPDNAVTTKAAWMVMGDMPQSRKEQYYTRNALVRDPLTGVCKSELVGLVGLHIVQKTVTRPQWIWVTFEHIENVPPPTADPSNTYAFNNGDGNVMKLRYPYAIPPFPASPPLPFNVNRLQLIHDSTDKTNKRYRKALGDLGSVWQYYQLVMTQWPKAPNQALPIDPNMRGTPDNTVPGTGFTTTVSNTVMETFLQLSIDTGCMACHNNTMQATDFVWSIRTHAYTPGPADRLANDPAVRALRLLLQRSMSTTLDKAEPQNRAP